MTKVTMHKSADGQLHPTATACKNHEASLRVLKAASEAVYDMSLFESDDFGESNLNQGQLTKFIVANAAVLRKVLNEANVVRRVRKAKTVARPVLALAA